MLTSNIISASLLALASTSLAQYTKQSKPFQLVLHSKSQKYDGVALGACHEGAAIEGLCTAYGGSTFYFNTTDSEYVANKEAGATGYLTWVLPAGGENVSQPMSLIYNDASNVALPLFEPTSPNTMVAFDKNNHMNIQSYINDRVSPPEAGNTTAYYRWYACETLYTGYTYTTLAWVMGKYPPQNPSCKKVEIKMQYNTLCWLVPVMYCINAAAHLARTQSSPSRLHTKTISSIEAVANEPLGHLTDNQLLYSSGPYGQLLVPPFSAPADLAGATESVGRSTVASFAVQASFSPFQESFSSAITGGSTYLSDLRTPSWTTATKVQEKQVNHFKVLTSKQNLHHESMVAEKVQARSWQVTVTTGDTDEASLFIPPPTTCQTPPCSTQIDTLTTRILPGVTSVEVSVQSSSNSLSSNQQGTDTSELTAPTMSEAVPSTRTVIVTSSSMGPTAANGGDLDMMHHGLNGSVIVAIVLAAVAACAIIVAALWYTRHHWMALLLANRHDNKNSDSNHDNQSDPEGGNVDAASTQALPDTGSEQVRYGSRMSIASPELAKDDDGNSLSINQADSSRCTPIGIDNKRTSIHLKDVRVVSANTLPPLKFDNFEESAFDGHLLPLSPCLSRVKPLQTPVSPVTDEMAQDSTRSTVNLVTPTSDAKYEAYAPSVSSKGGEPLSNVGPRRTTAPQVSAEDLLRPIWGLKAPLLGKASQRSRSTLKFSMSL
ncbi:hypothetical protein KC315_g14416 [Hortaea werneckii]|nr:hypothetical protein KC315_g14416 [Hortaea werneckii]KAI7360885.1 hypothetical protein KC354_g8516 [Hortaea werneckii]